MDDKMKTGHDPPQMTSSSPPTPTSSPPPTKPPTPPPLTPTTIVKSPAITSTMNNVVESSPKDLPDDAVYLRKELGLLEAVAIIVGSIIGAGIFISPKGVLEYAGSVGMSLVVWASCGMVTTVGALCFAELGTMIPESGGMYSYLLEAFGPAPAFLYFWVSVVVKNSAGAAVVAVIFASYLLQALFPDCGAPLDIPTKLLAAVLICFLSWLNCVRVKWVTKVQNVFTVTKVLALVLIIVMGVYHLARGNVQNYLHPMEGTNWAAPAISAAFYQSLFAYGGWENMYNVVEELRNPSRNLPLAIIFSTTLVTVVYTLANIAYLAVLTPAEILSSNAVAMVLWPWCRGHGDVNMVLWP
ncbi:Y+L amino acid transporter 2-like 11 [Homarus americanus]|uniref:Y+L amino acid transporter 2-like 11 n=1 Tax=Homarus americanus TaxID=6706 RepID=A0A8J5JG84_HOMAM|nr:Y+L amino acid transporter 2-like 11 [Homarus americanus]